MTESLKHADREPTEGAEFCRLCKRAYCLPHKSTTEKSADVCEINHTTYYLKHNKVMNGWKIFRDLEQRREELGEKGVEEEEEKIMKMAEEEVSSLGG